MNMDNEETMFKKFANKNEAGLKNEFIAIHADNFDEFVAQKWMQHRNETQQK